MVDNDEIADTIGPSAQVSEATMDNDQSDSSIPEHKVASSAASLLVLARAYRLHFSLYIGGVALTLVVALCAILLLLQVSSVGGFRRFVTNANDTDDRILSSVQGEVLKQARVNAEAQAERENSLLVATLETVELQRLLINALFNDESDKQSLTNWIAVRPSRLSQFRSLIDSLLSPGTTGYAFSMVGAGADALVVNKFGGPCTPASITGEPPGENIYVPGLSEPSPPLEVSIEHDLPIPLSPRPSARGSSAEEIVSRLSEADEETHQHIVERLRSCLSASETSMDSLAARRDQQQQFAAHIDAVIGDFGQPSSSAELAIALANFVVRVGALGLVIFVIQILLSFTRYHARMTDHYRNLNSAFVLADGDIDLFTAIAPIVAQDIDFGKTPLSAFERTIDSLRDVITTRK